MKKDQMPVPEESVEQTWLFRWATMMSQAHPELRTMFHVPNGGSRNKIEAAKFKAQGVKPGVPDVVLPVPSDGYHGLFIEMKRRSGGRVSEDQAAWIEILRKYGYKAEVCKGFDEAVKLVEEYLHIKEG